MKCAKRNFIFTMVNAVADSKCQYERSEIMAHFESQTVLEIQIRFGRLEKKLYLKNPSVRRWRTPPLAKWRSIHSVFSF
jgi:hypothetical protein